MGISPDQLANHLLASIPQTEWQRIAPLLEAADLPLGCFLYESVGTMEHVYFPINAIVSLLYVMEDGDSAEIAVVGNEGLVGISLFMGGGSTPSRAVVQSAGKGYRLPSASIKEEFNRSGPMLHLLLRYTQALITQMAQTAACNRHHSLVQQLCRWLLLSLDRLSGNELVMTQELIANMLSVRRERVTVAALKLQELGLIKYVRGHITVLDHGALEGQVCECYAVVKKEYDRLLPDRQATYHSANVRWRTDIVRRGPLQERIGQRVMRDPEPGPRHDHSRQPSHSPATHARAAKGRHDQRGRCARWPDASAHIAGTPAYRAHEAIDSEPTPHTARGLMRKDQAYAWHWPFDTGQTRSSHARRAGPAAAGP